MVKTIDFSAQLQSSKQIKKKKQNITHSFAEESRGRKKQKIFEPAPGNEQS